MQIKGPLDAHSVNDIITTSVIAWSFYPKLLIRDGKGWRSIANSQTLSLHPTSVNKGSTKPRYLSFYNVMQSGSKFHNATNAFFTSIAHEIPLLLIAGDADFKNYCGVLTLDSNRLRFAITDQKTMLAIKILRGKLRELVDWIIQRPKIPISSDLRWHLEVFEKICTRPEKEG
jgi:ATP-dependent RNA helicase DHX29